MNPFSWSFQKLFFLGAFTCFASLAYALYVQYHMLMMPCPLCVFQRIAFVLTGLFFLVGALHNPTSITVKKIYAGLAILAALSGAVWASRHIYIQLSPPDANSFCSSLGLDYMLDAMPLKEVLLAVFKGSGECAKIDWTFLGLSMPMWTLILYTKLVLLAVFAVRKRAASV